MFIAPPPAICHTKSGKHELLTFRDMLRGNNMKSKPVGNQVSLARGTHGMGMRIAIWICGRISRID